jgi:transcriptional regulator with PAS, ATPase and Fis domain
MDLLIFEPDSGRKIEILAQLNNNISYQKIDSIDSLLYCLEHHFYKAIVFDLDFLKKSDTVNILQNIRNISPETFLIGVTSLKTNQLVNKISPYKISIIEYNKEGLQHLAILIKYFIEQVFHFPADNKKDIRFIGENPIIKSIIDRVNLIKDSDVHILITGETGSGKTELARYIHIKSKRKTRPFMHINCAAIPDNLLESELFGYKAGAFTGAVKNKAGKFQAARNGTICLDEIAEIPMHLQAKLLKVLDEKSYYPIGGVKPVKMNARIIAATNKDIIKAVNAKKFREDLYYRINAFEIDIPPLRERIDDIPELFDFFVDRYSELNRISKPEINEAVYKILKNYYWGGNIRELQNVVESVLCRRPKQLSVKELPKELFVSPEAVVIRSEANLDSMAKLKKEYAKQVYKLTKENKLKTARILNIDVKTLRKLLE